MQKQSFLSESHHPTLCFGKAVTDLPGVRGKNDSGDAVYLDVWRACDAPGCNQPEGHFGR